VIGNGSYKSSPLKNPTNDAHDMALVLKTLVFEVTHLENAEHRTMERAIRKFGKQLRNGGAGLFYFAGHGIQVKGRNYLIPVDAEIETESDVRFEAVDAGRVLGKMDDAGNALNIVILDACRDNPFSRSFRTSNQGLARMDAPKGSLIAYATAPGSIAADGEGRNGIYTKYLLKYAKTPGLTVEQILKKVRVEVLKETNNKQVPWESSSLTGNFHFNPVKSEMKPSTIKPQKTPKITQQEGLGEKYETLFWDSIKESKDAETFKAYLNKFPNGVFAELARMNIKKYSHQIEEKPAEKLSADIPAGFSGSEAKEAGRDGTFIAYTTGVVYDKNTGLEWYAGPDKDTTWNEAKRWVESLNVAGGGWRMPTIKELKTLYKKAAGERNRTPLLKTTGLYVWSSKTKSSSSSWAFAFHRGSESWAHHVDSSNLRGFAVRSRR
ncbi:MAG: caspase family protein, partial [Desulfobacterales bacterium]